MPAHCATDLDHLLNLLQSWRVTKALQHHKQPSVLLVTTSRGLFAVIEDCEEPIAVPDDAATAIREMFETVKIVRA